jgi:hypothetical protein
MQTPSSDVGLTPLAITVLDILRKLPRIRRRGMRKCESPSHIFARLAVQSTRSRRVLQPLGRVSEFNA